MSYEYVKDEEARYFEREAQRLKDLLNAREARNVFVPQDQIISLSGSPDRVEIVTVYPGPRSVQVDWEPARTPNLRNYEVELDTDPTFPDPRIQEAVDLTTVFEDVDPDLPFYVRVRVRTFDDAYGLYSPVVDGLTGGIVSGQVAPEAANAITVASVGTPDSSPTTLPTEYVAEIDTAGVHPLWDYLRAVPGPTAGVPNPDTLPPLSIAVEGQGGTLVCWMTMQTFGLAAWGGVPGAAYFNATLRMFEEGGVVKTWPLGWASDSQGAGISFRYFSTANLRFNRPGDVFGRKRYSWDILFDSWSSPPLASMLLQLTYFEATFLEVRR